MAGLVFALLNSGTLFSLKPYSQWKKLTLKLAVVPIFQIKKLKSKKARFPTNPGNIHQN
jgi:hypothetical protein